MLSVIKIIFPCSHHKGHCLHFTSTNRYYKPSADLELVRQFFRYLSSGGCNNNPVKWSVLGFTFITVAIEEIDCIP